jgi:hypothetical protein
VLSLPVAVVAVVAVVVAAVSAVPAAGLPAEAAARCSWACSTP